MKTIVKSGVIGVTFGVIPLKSSADRLDNQWCRNDINTELFKNLDRDSFDVITENEWLERINVVTVKPKIVIDAVMNYFDEDVKMFKLSQQAKNKLTLMLNSYLSVHPILKVWSDWTLIFGIDDKKAFATMVKNFVNIVLEDMPFLVRKIIIPLFLGWYDTIQQKLDNLDSTAMNLKEKQYKDVVFDNVAWFIKRVASSVKWDMTIGDYYDIIDGYYPNKNADKIRVELDKLWLTDKDIKDLKYPFGK